MVTGFSPWWGQRSLAQQGKLQPKWVPGEGNPNSITTVELLMLQQVAETFFSQRRQRYARLDTFTRPGFHAPLVRRCCKNSHWQSPQHPFPLVSSFPPATAWHMHPQEGHLWVWWCQRDDCLYTTPATGTETWDRDELGAAGVSPPSFVAVAGVFLSRPLPRH